jgi:solute carrier family 9 (sodium/hydrogen exchanger), member 8
MIFLLMIAIMFG